MASQIQRTKCATTVPLPSIVQRGRGWLQYCMLLTPYSGRYPGTPEGIPGTGIEYPAKLTLVTISQIIGQITDRTSIPSTALQHYSTTVHGLHLPGRAGVCTGIEYPAKLTLVTISQIIGQITDRTSIPSTALQHYSTTVHGLHLPGRAGVFLICMLQLVAGC